MLTDLDHTNPNTRDQGITNLRKHIQTSARNEITIIGLDADKELLPNDAPVKETSISVFMQELNLTDVFQYQHGHTGDTSRKNSKKIDHILVSANVLPAIQHSGFLPWNKIMESDHRTGYVDFDALTLFGNTDDLTHSASRKLTTDYPEAMEEYLKHLQKGFVDRKVLSTLERIVYKAKKNGWTTKLMKTYDRLDQEVTNIMLKAEQQCTPTTTHISEWSTTLEQATRAIRYWNMRISQYKKQKGNQDIINEEKAAGKVIDTSTTLEEAQQLKNKAWAPPKDSPQRPQRSTPKRPHTKSPRMP